MLNNQYIVTVFRHKLHTILIVDKLKPVFRQYIILQIHKSTLTWHSNKKDKQDERSQLTSAEHFASIIQYHNVYF